MKRILFSEKRIHSCKLKSHKGASVLFALVGFLFAAMISMVVVNAAYSAASRVKKLKYDEQAFLLAQSMSGIISDALSGDDGLTISYQYIEQKNFADGKYISLYFYKNNENEYSISAVKSFTDIIGKNLGSDKDAAKAVRSMFINMAKKIDIDKTVDNVNETLTTTVFINPESREEYHVETKIKMDKFYSINAETTARVMKGDKLLSEYKVRMKANAVTKTDKTICCGTRSDSNIVITGEYNPSEDIPTGEELIRINSFCVTWPPEYISNVHF